MDNYEKKVQFVKEHWSDFEKVETLKDSQIRIWRLGTYKALIEKGITEIGYSTSTWSGDIFNSLMGTYISLK